MLYFRMIFIMLITLYTSRVILNALGVSDFGIYNIVAGVVVLFSFFGNSMVAATQRFMNVAIGKNDNEYIQDVFSTSIISQIGLIAGVLLAGETIGLWFVKTQLDIPSERMDVALVIYHLAILTTCATLLRVPYNASIIANERMSFYAYVSIVEAVLKLLIVWILVWSEFDKLVLYSALLLAVNIIINAIYVLYCKRHFVSNKFILKTDKVLFREMATFSGWNLLGGISDIAYKQGTNIILNIFCGVALNAALGITNQIRAAVYSFVSNLQTAANPQIVKSYSMGDYVFYRSLVYRISKFSYFLMMMLALPIIANIDLILEVWLKNPPEYTNSFTILIMVFSMIDSLTGPLWVSMQARGKLKVYQIVICSCMLLNLPLTYLFLYLGFSPNSLLIVQIAVLILTLSVRIAFAHYCLTISISSYLKEVVSPIIRVTIPSAILLYVIYCFTEGFTRLGISCMAVLPMAILTYTLGLRTNEKFHIKEFINKKILKRI